jgi:hypothetical protein
VIFLAVLGDDAALGLVPTDAASNVELMGEVLAVHDSGLPGGDERYLCVPPRAAGNVRFECRRRHSPDRASNILVHDALPVP